MCYIKRARRRASGTERPDPRPSTPPSATRCARSRAPAACSCRLPPPTLARSAICGQSLSAKVFPCKELPGSEFWRVPLF